MRRVLICEPMCARIKPIEGEDETGFINKFETL